MSNGPDQPLDKNSSAERPRVFNTRPRAQAAELSRLLERAGFDVVEAAAIEVEAAWDPAVLQQVRLDLVAGAFEWVVLPSQNAGLLLADVLTRSRVVCGSQTARALGLQPTYRLDRFDARAAIGVLRPVLARGERVLLPRGAESRDELIDGLLALGAALQAPIAYQTVAVDPATLIEAARGFGTAQIQAVTVCSPSAVRSLLAALDRQWLSQVSLVSLGETTAAAARQAGLHVAAVAESTSMQSLVAAVSRALDVGGCRQLPDRDASAEVRV